MLRFRRALAVGFVILSGGVCVYHFRIQHCKGGPCEIHSVPQADEF